MEHELETFFTRFGFPEGSAGIYHTLLEQGHLGVSDIARVLEMHRPAVYELLSQLEKAGFVSKRPSGRRTHYVAAHPKALSLYARNAATEAEDLVPLLAQRYVDEQNSAVRVLLGREGIAGAYMDIVLSLPAGATFYHYTAVQDQPKIDGYVPREYREVRDRKQLERLTITNKSVETQKKPRLERYLKVLDQRTGSFDQNVDVFVYGSKVSVFSFDEERAVIIDDPRVADFHKQIFMRLFAALS